MSQPVTNEDLQRVLTLLNQYPNVGVPAHALAETFGSAEHVRQIMAQLVELGLASVILAESVAFGHVWRLTKNDAEVKAEVQRLQAAAERLNRRAQGLQIAWAKGGISELQMELF